MKKQTKVLFYILSTYIILQFIWWAYHLVDLTSKLNSVNGQHKQFIMIIGEGLVFFVLLIFGLWKIRSSIQKEINISQRQNNFLLSVTHELKTPLASNKLNLQTILKRKNLTNEQKVQLIQQALKENGRLEYMIENILTATRIENQHFQLNFETCKLGDLIYKTVDDWSMNRAPVELNLDHSLKVEIDVFTIKSVLLNLLENAYKYAGDKPKIEVYLKKENNNIIWGVKDSGEGIPISHKKIIFNKFVRLGNEETRHQKGTGLGLFIVKKLLKYNQFSISYIPNKPKGAHFKIISKYSN